MHKQKTILHMHMGKTNQAKQNILMRQPVIPAKYIKQHQEDWKARHYLSRLSRIKLLCVTTANVPMALIDEMVNDERHLKIAKLWRNGHAP